MDWMLTETQLRGILWGTRDDTLSAGYEYEGAIAKAQARKLVEELQKIIVPWVEGTEYEGKVDYWGITNDEWQQLRKEVGL